MNHAKGLKNVEALTGGKSDPYVRVMSGMQPRGQTEVVLDNLDPVWDTALYVPIHSMREDLLLEVMDWNDVQKDKFLGMCELLIKDIVAEKKNENDQTVYEALPAIKRTVELISHERKTGRGQLNYEASFFPTLALAKQATDEEKEDKETKEEKKEETDAEKVDAEKVDAENVDALKETLPKQDVVEKDLNGEIIHYTADKKIDLLTYESGVLSVTIHQVQLPSKTKAVVEILVDSNDAQYRTSQQKGDRLCFNETGDAFVKEMEFSRLVLNVRKPDDKGEERIGFFTSTIRDIVKEIMNGSFEEDKSKEHRLVGCAEGKIHLSFKFTPVVRFKLDPSESLESK